MPRGAKLVLAFQALFVLLTLALLVGGLIHRERLSVDLVRLVVLGCQVALLMGLVTRRRGAWRIARWVAGFFSFSCVGLVLGATIYVGSGAGLFRRTEESEMLWWNLMTAVAAIIFFRLLGRSDSRLYLNAPKKA